MRFIVITFLLFSLNHSFPVRRTRSAQNFHMWEIFNCEESPGSPRCIDLENTEVQNDFYKDKELSFSLDKTRYYYSLEPKPIERPGCATLPGLPDCYSENRIVLRSRARQATNADESSKVLPTDPAENEATTDSQTTSMDNSELLEEDENSDVCFFNVERKTHHETKSRSYQSSVSTNCDGELTRMEELMEQKKEPLFESSNSLDLLLCRGAGYCNLNFDDQSVAEEYADKKVCEAHKKELLTDWNNPKYRHTFRPHSSMKRSLCSMNGKIGIRHSRRPILASKSSRTLNKHEADALLKETGYLVHPGIPVCAEHKKFAQLVFSQNQVESQGRNIDPPPASGLLAESESIEDEAHNSCRVSQNDPDFHPPRVSEPRIPPEITPDMKKTFLYFSKACRQTHAVSRDPFVELTYRYRRRKVMVGRNLLDTTCKIMAGESSKDFKTMVCGSEKTDMWTRNKADSYGKLLSFVAERFMRSENRVEGYVVLSLIAKVVPLSQIREYIPGLSWHVYNEARKIRVVKETLKRSRREKYNPESVNEFVTFITSNNILSPHTFGTKKSKYSDGTIVELPNTIRKSSASHIIEMYHGYLKDSNKEDLKLGDSTYFKILSVCSATPQKATACVDYYLADGIEASEQLEQILKKWHDSMLIDDEVHDELSKGVSNAFQYFRSDYRLHVKMDSRVADHCGRYALSDPEKQAFSSACEHSHDLRCDVCENAKILFGDIRDRVRFLIETTEKELKATDVFQNREKLEKLKDDENAIIEAEKKIYEMKKHLLRAKITDEFRSDIIQDLQQNEGMLTLDFAQKLLPMKYNERQTDYFGKRGLSYHIGHIVANISFTHVTHSFIHILRGELQDSDSVTSIVEHIMGELAKMNIERVIIRSDNAGNYHSASTIGSINSISKNSGVDIKRWAFSEVQNGKSSCDRVASLAKRKIHTYVDSGNDVTNVEEFFKSLSTGRQLKATSVFLARIQRPQIGEKTKIEAISSLYDFSFTRSYIRASKYEGIGEGVFIPVKTIKPNLSYLIIENVGGFLADAFDAKEETRKIKNNDDSGFWFSSNCAKNRVCRKENEANKLKNKIDDHDLDEKQTNDELFYCPEPGCSASYVHYSNLQKHIISGKHNIAPERITLLDRSLNMFEKRIEDLDQTRVVLPAVEEALDELKQSQVIDTSNPPEGWALKTRQVGTRFSESARSFLTELFEEGKRTGQKYDGKKAEKLMKNAKFVDGSRRFQPSECLTERQINGLFSRFSQKDRYGAHSRQKRSSLEPCSGTMCDDNTNPDLINEEKEWFEYFEEDELSGDYELIFLKDASTPSLDTMFRNLIQNNLHEIFETD